MAGARRELLILVRGRRIVFLSQKMVTVRLLSLLRKLVDLVHSNTQSSPEDPQETRLEEGTKGTKSIPGSLLRSLGRPAQAHSTTSLQRHRARDITAKEGLRRENDPGQFSIPAKYRFPRHGSWNPPIVITIEQFLGEAWCAPGFP